MSQIFAPVGVYPWARGLSRGLAAGVYPAPSKFADDWRLERRFKPNMSKATRERKPVGGAGGEGASGERWGRGSTTLDPETPVAVYYF
jgi:hypothetical protein